MRKRKGFTMVELMVVIIIMAVLGLAVVPSLMGSSDKSKYSRAWNDLNAIANAFTAYYGRDGNLPAITAGDLSGAIPDANKDLFQSFLGTPLADLKDPWGKEYQVAGSWDPATGKGHIIVFVDPGDTTGTAATFATGVIATARTDPYNGDRSMAKLVVNVM